MTAGGPIHTVHDLRVEKPWGFEVGFAITNR
jgi:hypothetical protein